MPVVATGWSGNMSYMNHDNAGLVRYTMVATTEESVIYSPSALGIASCWAESDIDHAAAWLRALATDPSLRTAYGESAAAASARYDAQARELTFVREIEALLRQGHLFGRGNVRSAIEHLKRAEHQTAQGFMGAARRLVTRHLARFGRAPR